jgi:hypothetical protein
MKRRALTLVFAFAAACGGGHSTSTTTFPACATAPDLESLYGEPCDPGLGEGYYGGSPCEWRGEAYASCVPSLVQGEACDPQASAACTPPLVCLAKTCAL